MSDSELYSRLLFPKKQGYPLFHPQPSDDLPEAARRIGTEIGDVGVITQDGSFDPIFNILRARDDPANRFGVPPDFEQVVLGSEDIRTRSQFYLPGSDISNTTIRKRRIDFDAGVEGNVFLPFGAGAVVEVSMNSKETGLLLLPDGASRWDLRREQLFRDYAMKHAHSWYAFVNGNLQRRAGNGDLYLVTGVTKSTSWSVAAIENQSGEGQISLKLKAAQFGNAGATCSWEWENAGSSVDSGPRRHPGEENWRENQTVFLRGFKVAVRVKPLRRAPKIHCIVESDWPEMQSKGTFIPFSQSQSSTLSVFTPSSQTQSSGHNENGISRSGSSPMSSPESSSDGETPSSCYHPSTLINEHLLNCAVDATVAVTHDDEWASVLTEQDSKVPDHHELIRRMSSKFRMATVSGGVCFQSFDTDISPSAHTLPTQISSVDHYSILMFGTPHIQSGDQLNPYNVAQLQDTLGADKEISSLNTLSPDPDATLIVPDVDYDSRRVSSLSSTISADTESSSLSLGEKRAITPNGSPRPKKSRAVDQYNWEVDSSEGRNPSDDEDPLDPTKVSLPSIFTTFEDSYRPERRASLPNLSERSSVRNAPYPPSHLRQNYAPSSLSSYTFPPDK
ncbi:Cell division control protein [Mycena venus]|uniref:Cell division control protein n=1 Tax=Mycena venus TaxID=2733690 RepID=A0A8H7CPJ2_9AGAR|nr:Cell division control protein [Mycena venus]